MIRFAALALVVSSTVASSAPPASPGRTDRIVRKIGSMKLLYSGLSAEIDPPNPVVPKNTPAGVRVVVRAGGEELTESEANRFFEGPFLIEGEIAGPALPRALTVRSAPSSFLLPLPALEIAGDYSLSNVRILVEGKSVLDASPARVVVDVIEQVLVTSVTTRPLTLDELVERGVVFDGDDVVGFEFTLAMTLESKRVNISFPVAFDREGLPVPQPLSPPLDPRRTGVDVDLPPLPTVVPVMLETADGGEPPEIDLPGQDPEPVRIPSVLVIPGDVGFLKQFFSAQLFVANGAPAGARLVVRDVRAEIHLPGDGSLSLPELTTGVQATTLPILGEGGDGFLNAGEQGQAEFLVRGEKEGFHTLAFDIDAVLEGLAGGDVALSGRATGGVLVRKPFFDLTFAVPSVVRADEEFELFVTVHNIGPGIANRIDVSFDDHALSGLELAPGAPATHRIDTLQPGEMATLVYDFKSLRTGQVVASYLRFDGESAVDGSVHFTLGVADGVPLSPDTLVLPGSVDALDASIVRAGMRVLGQAWSIAKAPSGTLAPGIQRIRTSVVIEKALLLAEAGLRVQLGENHDSAVRGLLFDFYGGSPPDQGFQNVLHTMAAGRAFGETLALALEDAMADAGGATEYERATARLAASGPDFLTFALESSSVEVEAPEGSLLLSNDEGLFGMIPQPTSSPYIFSLSAAQAISTRISVTLPRGDGTFVRGSGLLELESGDAARLVVDLFRPEELAIETDSDGDGVYETVSPLATESLSSEGPELLSATLIGPEVFEGASAFGFHAAALFDRVVEEASASDRDRYRIPDNSIRGAKRQLSGRVVFLTLDRPEGPYESTTLESLEIEDLRGADRTGRVPFSSLLADPGAIVTGRVFEAGGRPASGGSISYANFRSGADCVFREELVFAEVPLESDATYELRYVRRDPCGSPFRILYRDLRSGELRDVTGFVRAPGERIRLDLALFGRGSVTGRVFENGSPAPGAKVVVTSQTSAQSGGVDETDGDGRYVVHDIVVGPVSVKAARGIAIGLNSGRIARAGTTAVVDVVLDPGRVRVRGTVSKLENGQTTPVAGAQVVYALEVPPNVQPLPVGVTRSAADGSYVLEDLPFGNFELTAALDAEARASLHGASTPGQDRLENLVIVIAPPAELGTVEGRVVLPDGSGASGAIVSVGARQVVAAADGSFGIPGVSVRPGEIQSVLAITADGKRQGQASVLIASPGQIVENVIITLSGLGSIELTVLDQNGTRVPRQKVGLLGLCDNLCGCASALTTSEGVATFTDLPPGTHFAKAVLVGAGFIDVATGSARIEKDKDVGSGVLRFAGLGTVTGKVLLPGGVEPAPGSDVTLTSQIFDRDACELRRGISHRGRTDANGLFEFTNVNFGQVSATASHPFADTNVGATATLTPATPVDFRLVLVDSTAGRVTGTVFLPDGITPAGGGVEVSAVGPLPEVSVRTRDDGTYEFRPIFPQGMYTFTVRDPVTGFVAREQLFLRVGEDAAHDFRLKGRGAVRVRVLDAAGAPVETAYVKLSESEFPLNAYDAVLAPSSQGVATFSNVFEGPFSVEAKDVFGRDGGRVPSVLPGDGAEIDVEVRLNAVGTVKGRFLMPGINGGDPIPFGVVTLLSGNEVVGRATTEGSGVVGSFLFDYVPIGPFRLEAQDPLTARHGFATGELRAQDETLVLDVSALGLGRVEGTIRADGLPQAAAQVELVSGSFRAATAADDFGFYFIEGVPEGRIVATASLANGFLAGTDEATLVGDGSTLVLDVALRDSATVIGRVTRALSDDAAPPSIVTLSGLSTTTDPLDGSFRFERVPAGLAILDATVLGSIDRGRKVADLPAGGVVDVTIPLNGVGAIRAQVPGAGRLTLRGTGDFPYVFVFTLGDGGTLFLPEVLAGPVTATLEVAGPPKLFGTASGLVLPGATLDLPVAIEPTGTVRGLVRRADGAPAAGATVIFLLASGRGAPSVQARDGSFEAEGIPLGSFDIRVEDPFSGGVGFENDLEIDFEGQILDGIVIDLDDSPVRVLEVDPPDGAIEVPTSQVVRVTFSDPVAALNGAFRVSGLSLAPALAADGLSATLTGVLPDSRTLTVEVSTELVDIFGRRPVTPFTSTFRTVDVSPPKAVATTPADGAFEVPASQIFIVFFDEPLGDATDFTSLLSLVGPRGSVAGASERFSATEARFTPDAPLADDALYQLVVNGAVDEIGNRQTIPATVARIASHDTVAPVLGLLSPLASSWISNPRPGIQVSVTDNASGIAPSTAAMTLDGNPVPAVVQGDRILFTPPSDLSEGEHPVSASIADRALNRGGLSGSFSVDVTAPSTAEIASPAAGATLVGVVRFRAAASDVPSGVARIDLRSNGSLFTSLLAPSFEKDFDTSLLLEGDALLTARAVDRAGNAGPESAAVPVKVDNRAITVTFLAPTANLRVRDSVDVRVIVSEAVERVKFEIGGLEIVDPTAPYQATLDVTGVSEGPQPILATAFGLADTGSASRIIVIDRTPPSPPDPDLVFAEPPAAGASLVHGLSGAVEGKALVAASNLDTGASATTSAMVDGSFTLSLAASVGDVVSLTAEDDVGNRSAPTTTLVRSLPTLPPSEDAARLRFEGVVADRVGLSALAPDGELDAVFTLTLTLGDGVTRTLDYIDLEGSPNRMLHSTRASAGAVLGVAPGVAEAFLNDVDFEVSFDVTESASLTLIAADEGFVVEGDTYTVTLVFLDGARLVGKVTVVPEADERGVPHSVRISASPETVVVPPGVQGTTLLTLENIRDVEGTPVPDGAKIAVAVSDMATVDPFGSAIRSAGGRILDGEIAGNNAAFRVFPVNDGSVVLSYASDVVVPSAVAGAQAVVQVLAADEMGNVLGNEAIGTLDLNLRSVSDRALFALDSVSLYADKRLRKRSFRMELRDPFGFLVPDGTKVIVSAAPCAGRIASVCIDSFGGTILGGLGFPSGQSFPYFETQGGSIAGEYETPPSFVVPGDVRLATLQALPATATGALASQNTLGTARIPLVGAAGAEIDLSPSSVPIVATEPPVQVRVRHVHDSRANLVPGDATLILSAAPCATRDRAGACILSDGGLITDGAVGLEGAAFRVFALSGGAVNATYEARDVTAIPGGVKLARIQVAMADADGRRVNQAGIGVRELPLLAPAHAVGIANPTALLADGSMQTSTILFSPILDAFGNPLPDWASVLASALSFEGTLNGVGIPSVPGARITNGQIPGAGQYRIFSIEEGRVTPMLGVENVASPVGRIQEANVVLLIAGASNNLVNREVLGVVPVKLPGTTSGLAAANPPVVEADGADRRSVITVSNLRDALGAPVPDGTFLAVSASSCAARVGSVCVTPDVAATVIGEEMLPSLPLGYGAFTVRGGQIVAEISTSGVNVTSGTRTAIAQVLAILPSGAAVAPNEALAAVEVELVRPGVDRVEAAPLGVFASGNATLSSITVRLASLADGTQVALTADDCAARTTTGACIASVGGSILPAGTSPGDGEAANGDPRFRLFTVSGGEVKAVYSSEGQVAGITQMRIARVSVVVADGSGNVVSPQALASGEVHLWGATAATSNGPTSLKLTGGPTGKARITFAGIRDGLGNTLPDGTIVLATAADCGTFLSGTVCNVSKGGTLLDGAPSNAGPQFRAYTVNGGSVTVTYSTAGASVGQVRIQLAPAANDGTLIGNRSLIGGVHLISVTSP